MNDLRPSSTSTHASKSQPGVLVNGHSPLNPAAMAHQDREDRESTMASIRSSLGSRKQPIDIEEIEYDLPQQAAAAQKSDTTPQKKVPAKQYEEVEDEDLEDIEMRVAAREDAEEAPPTPAATSRSESPSTVGSRVDFEGLSWPSIGALGRLHERERPEEAAARLQKLSGAVRTILECIGEDPDREGLHGTPERYAKALMYFTKGYEENLRDIVNGAIFNEDHDELVMVKDIEVHSLCEHHLVPFTGKVS